MIDQLLMITVFGYIVTLAITESLLDAPKTADYNRLFKTALLIIYLPVIGIFWLADIALSILKALALGFTYTRDMIRHEVRLANRNIFAFISKTVWKQPKQKPSPFSLTKKAKPKSKK